MSLMQNELNLEVIEIEQIKVNNETKLKLEQIKAKDDEVVEKVKANAQKQVKEIKAHTQVVKRQGNELAQVEGEKVLASNQAKI